MKRLIVYDTKHGCTAEVVEEMRRHWAGEPTVILLKQADIPDLEGFDQVIVGGSIHAGQIQKSVKQFCETHRDRLLSKPLGLFLCCMDDEKGQAQFESAFDVMLRNHATATGVLGGAFDFEKMNRIERFIVKKVAGATATVKRLDEDAIARFAETMNI